MKLLCLGLCLVAPALAEITVDQGVTVNFGDAIEDVAKKLGETATQPSPARNGIDQSIVAAATTLNFDSGRLWRVAHGAAFAYVAPLEPFAEHWKNPSAIPADPAAGKIFPRMTREQFNSYFNGWKQRAERSGKREGTDYWVKETSGIEGDKLSITLGPRRKLVGTGELAGDMWTVSFTGATDHRYRPQVPIGTLKQLTMSRDEFRTAKRGSAEVEAAVAESPRPKTNAGPGLTLPDGTHLHFGQEKAEVEKLLGVEAHEISQLGARTGIDQRITLPHAAVHFDTGRLARIEFRRMSDPLTPFEESWKNLDPIGEVRLKAGMTVTEVNAYLEAWEKRAAAAGKVRDQHFRVGQSSTARGGRLIWMQSGRRSPAGGWMDAWSLGFTMPAKDSTQEPKLVAVTASCGELNTNPAPARTQQMREMRAAGKNVPLPEVDLPKPEILPGK